MKEDVLEQVVDDYLKFLGYFTTHNLRFRPEPEDPGYVQSDDSVPSDIDVVGIHPRKRGLERVVVVSCKAYQRGFDASAVLARLQGVNRDKKRPTWKGFRELWNPKWSRAFLREVEALTGTRRFTYRLAVTRLVGDGDGFRTDQTIRDNLEGCRFDFLTLETMWGRMLDELTTTPAASEIGRVAQLLKAAGLTSTDQVAPPRGPDPGSDAAIQEEAEIEASED